MTDNDDPFGRRDRTIIRPNPGGRRPAPSAQPGAPGAYPAPPAGGAPPASTPMPPVGYPPPPYAAPPAIRRRPMRPPSAPPPPGAQANWDGWMIVADAAAGQPLPAAERGGRADDAGADCRRMCRSISSPSPRTR